MKKRRHPVLKFFLLLIVLLGLLCADSGLRIVTTEYELSFADLPQDFDGWRIVQLSDLHGAQFGKDNSRLLQRVEAAQPDIIVLTGDLADSDTDLAVVEALLPALGEIAPVYYVSGNHEWSAGLTETLREMMEESSVRYLRNETLLLRRGDAEIALVGVEDPNGWKTQQKPDEVVAQLRAERPEIFTVLLGHRNDWVTKYPELPVQLIFCGHAHGGIVRLPWIGGLLGTGGTFLPEHIDGVERSGSYQLVISRGLGNSVPIPRLFNNPEIVAVTLRCD